MQSAARVTGSLTIDGTSKAKLEQTYPTYSVLF